MVAKPELCRVCITGGCGFLGRHLVRHLLLQPGVERLVVVDNLSVGCKDSVPCDRRVEMLVGDVRDPTMMKQALQQIDAVFHFAAPTDVRKALVDPNYDIEHGILGTQNVLECARQAQVPRVVFASSSCIYGSGLSLPVGESAGPLLPSSIYGAAKLAAEGLIAAYCNTFSMQAWIFRFPNVVGPEVTHGVVLDFIHKLQSNGTRLDILGNGNQTKTYLWAEDCIQGVLSLMGAMDQRVNVANVTTKNSTSVRDIGLIVAQEMELPEVSYHFSEAAQGWPGDVPSIILDDTLARSYGWEARFESSEAIRMTVRWLLSQSQSGASMSPR